MEKKEKKYNIGEWSEIYVFLKSLLDGKFSVMKADLKNKITEYEIIKIFKKDYNNTKELEFKPMLKDQKLLSILNLFLNKLISSNQTTFEVKEIEEYAENLNFSLNKGSSNQKNDLDAIIKDCCQKISSRLGYSIKSELSSKATLLNASSHTDFIYKVENFNPKDINLINSIVTKKKLKDRYDEIIKKGGKIIPIGASSNIFSLNLKCIDGDLETLLATMLLYSYIYNTKDIKKLIDLLVKNNPLGVDISKISNSFDYLKSLYSDKLLKFFNAIAFEMFPSSLMEKSNILFGGMLIMNKEGNILLLDKIYFFDELNNYFLNNLKLDSPSSTRYHMLELKQCSITNEIYFTLNLQIRFK